MYVCLSCIYTCVIVTENARLELGNMNQELQSQRVGKLHNRKAGAVTDDRQQTEIKTLDWCGLLKLQGPLSVTHRLPKDHISNPSQTVPIHDDIQIYEPM